MPFDGQQPFAAPPATRISQGSVLVRRFAVLNLSVVLLTIALGAFGVLRALHGG